MNILAGPPGLLDPCGVPQAHAALIPNNMGALSLGVEQVMGRQGMLSSQPRFQRKCGLLMKSCDVRRLYETVWLKAIQPLVPSMLQWSGVSSVKGGTLTSGPGKKYSGRYGRK